MGCELGNFHRAESCTPLTYDEILRRLKRHVGNLDQFRDLLESAHNQGKPDIGLLATTHLRFAESWFYADEAMLYLAGDWIEQGWPVFSGPDLDSNLGGYGLLWARRFVDDDRGYLVYLARNRAHFLATMDDQRQLEFPSGDN